MFLQKIKFILIIFILYQTPLYSKSSSFNNYSSKNLSKYFSGIVAFENKDSKKALNFFRSSKGLIHKHDLYLKRYIYSLVSENKILQAIDIIKQNKGKDNSKFLDAYFLLIIDSLKKRDLDQANKYLLDAINFTDKDRFDIAILETLKQFIFVFKENKISNTKKNFGKLSNISETFQRCYLEDPHTEKYFSNLINDKDGNFERYIYFYLSFLIEQNRTQEAKIIANDIKYINTTILLLQGKSWIEKQKIEKFNKIFSCKNHNDLIGEFFFIISNLYSSEDNFIKSNFFLNLSNYLNPKFIFNLSLIAENQFLNGEFKKAKKTLKNFKKEDDFYYWYRIKKEAQIIEKQRNKKESLNYIMEEFKKIDNPNNKILFDIANFNKNSEKYMDSIKFYSKIINTLDYKDNIKSNLLYRRGGSYERIGEYAKADKDFFDSLKIDPDDAYVLNYLAYSWLERQYKIDEAMEMLKRAYSVRNNDPYIIDSIGWAYYLVKDYTKAEKHLKRAVELMPDDPIVNDHYGDILWKLNRKIQARYFWTNVLTMDDTEDEMREKVNIKIIEGLKKS